MVPGKVIWKFSIFFGESQIFKNLTSNVCVPNQNSANLSLHRFNNYESSRVLNLLLPYVNETRKEKQMYVDIADWYLSTKSSGN